MTQADNSIRRFSAGAIGLLAALTLGLGQASAQPPKSAAPAPKAGSASTPQTWHVGDLVSAYIGGACCFDGTVTAVGTGERAGFYMIHFDNPATHDQYIKYSSLEARRASATPTIAAPKNLKPITPACGGAGHPPCLPANPPARP